MAKKPIEIRVEPAGLIWNCAPGETIMQCAHRHGYHWPTVCGGQGECGTCRFEISAGTENFEPETVDEGILFRRIARTSHAGLAVRFACRAKPTGPVTVRRSGVAPR